MMFEKWDWFAKMIQHKSSKLKKLGFCVEQNDLNNAQNRSTDKVVHLAHLDPAPDVFRCKSTWQVGNGLLRFESMVIFTRLVVCASTLPFDLKRCFYGLVAMFVTSHFDHFVECIPDVQSVHPSVGSYSQQMSIFWVKTCQMSRHIQQSGFKSLTTWSTSTHSIVEYIHHIFVLDLIRPVSWNYFSICV